MTLQKLKVQYEEMALEIFYVRNAKILTEQVKWITLGSVMWSVYYFTRGPEFRSHYLPWDAHKCLKH